MAKKYATTKACTNTTNYKDVTDCNNTTTSSNAVDCGGGCGCKGKKK